jgi:SAM-dependent methyltransferase
MAHPTWSGTGRPAPEPSAALALSMAKPYRRCRFRVVAEPGFVRDTRRSYDAVAADYAVRFREELTGRAVDNALLSAFAELVRTAEAGPVADIGCGAGRVTAILHGLGVPAFGVDLSPRMVEVARQSHPGLRFEVGSMLGLDMPDGALGGVLAWYSTIHIPDDRLPDAFAEFRRVLAPGGYVLLGFQAGDESRHVTQVLGHAVSLDARHRPPDAVAAALGQAGLMVQARVLREPDQDGAFPEKTQQAFVLARKPSDAAGPAGRRRR